MKKIIPILFAIVLSSTTLVAYKEIVVDLSEQKAYAIEDGFIIFGGAYLFWKIWERDTQW